MAPDDSPTGAVIVPVDGTDASVRAVALGARLAEVLGAELVVLSVISDFRSEAPTRVAHLRELLADVLPDTVERRIVQEPSITRTLAEASEEGLVCIATTAQPFDDEGIRHSVTDALVAEARSPVVVVGPKCPVDPKIDRIVVAIDPAHEQEGLVHWATRLGYRLHLPVEFVHVAGEEDDPAPDLGPKITVAVRRPGESVADRLLAESAGALLAMGSHGRTGVQRLMEGSVGAAVLPGATSPVLILGPAARAGQDDS